MKSAALWKDWHLLVLSFGGSMILAILGYVVLPEMMVYLQEHINRQNMVRVCFFAIFLSVSLLFLAGITFRVGKWMGLGTHFRIGAYIKRMMGFCVVALILFFLTGMLCGGISVAVHKLLSPELDFAKQKQVIDLLISQVALFILPVFFMQFITFSFSNTRFFQTLRTGFSALWYSYFKLLLAIIGLFILGAGFFMPLTYIESLWLERIWLIAISSLLGVISVVVVYEIGIRGLQSMHRRKQNHV